MLRAVSATSTSIKYQRTWTVLRLILHKGLSNHTIVQYPVVNVTSRCWVSRTNLILTLVKPVRVPLLSTVGSQEREDILCNVQDCFWVKMIDIRKVFSLHQVRSGFDMSKPSALRIAARCLSSGSWCNVSTGPYFYCLPHDHFWNLAHPTCIQSVCEGLL